MEVNAVKIKTKRTELSWTQQQLADACGVSLRTIQRVERYGNTSNETLMALASVFEIDKQLLVIAQEPVQEIQIVQMAKLPAGYLLGSLLLGVALGMASMYVAIR